MGRKLGILTLRQSMEEKESLHFPGEYFGKPLPGKAVYLVSRKHYRPLRRGPSWLLYSLGLCHKLMFPMFQEEINLLAKSVLFGAKWPGFTSAPRNLSAGNLRQYLEMPPSLHLLSGQEQCQHPLVKLVRTQ